MQVNTQLPIRHPSLPHSPFIHTYTHKPPSHTHFHRPYHLLLKMSTNGDLRWNTAHRGSLSWYVRLVILQSQFLSFWWAPVCHLPVHSVCPELWLRPLKCILLWYSRHQWRSPSDSQPACSHVVRSLLTIEKYSAWTGMTDTTVAIYGTSSQCN